jgi:hypothetical protein
LPTDSKARSRPRDAKKIGQSLFSGAVSLKLVLDAGTTSRARVPREQNQGFKRHDLWGAMARRSA